MYKITEKVPKYPLVSVMRLSAKAQSVYKTLPFCDKIVEAGDDTFIYVNPDTGSVTVSAPGGPRMLLAHAQIFERNILDVVEE
jgi:hypothetical protein